MKTPALIIATVLVTFVGIAAAKTCKDYKNCREAVIAWCNGQHPRADGDKDGIPCENVCKTLDQVEKIKKEIGCK